MLTGPLAAAGAYKTVVLRKYTLPQKKRNSYFQIRVSDPGSCPPNKMLPGVTGKNVKRSILDIWPKVH